MTVSTTGQKVQTLDLASGLRFTILQFQYSGSFKGWENRQNVRSVG